MSPAQMPLWPFPSSWLRSWCSDQNLEDLTMSREATKDTWFMVQKCNWWSSAVVWAQRSLAKVGLQGKRQCTAVVLVGVNNASPTRRLKGSETSRLMCRPQVRRQWCLRPPRLGSSLIMRRLQRLCNFLYTWYDISQHPAVAHRHCKDHGQPLHLCNDPGPIVYMAWISEHIQQSGYPIPLGLYN